MLHAVCSKKRGTSRALYQKRRRLDRHSGTAWVQLCCRILHNATCNSGKKMRTASSSAAATVLLEWPPFSWMWRPESIKLLSHRVPISTWNRRTCAGRSNRSCCLLSPQMPRQTAAIHNKVLLHNKVHDCATTEQWHH
jgi:hypothetical protein